MSTRNGSRIILSRTRGRRKSPATESSKVKEIPSLKDFLHRQKVIHQYRGFLKTLKHVNDEGSKSQILKEIRQSFSAYKYENFDRDDSEQQVAVSMAVKEGERRLKEFQSMVGYVDDMGKSDPDSWINIKDEEDPRGRVGTTWPWQRNN